MSWRHHIAGLAGAVIIVLTLLLVICAPLIVQHGPADIVGDVWARPSRDAWLGLDNLGRDLLSRLLFGGRTSIGLAFLITFLACGIGISAGFVAVVTGRWIDIVLSRIVDALLAIPQLIMALVVLSVLGTSSPVLVGTIAILSSPHIFRVSRAVAANLAVLPYVEVARARGEGAWWIVFREMLPNAVPTLLAEFGIRFCYTLLLIASLSFLGLGVRPPNADWGSMVKENASAITLGGWAPLYPAAAIALLTIAVNLVVDWFVAASGEAHGEGV